MCLNPLLAARLDEINPKTGKHYIKLLNGSRGTFYTYSLQYGKDNVFLLDCGKCPECLAKRGRDWAVRCMCEASLHKDNCFITLTYENSCLPKHGVCKTDLQKFFKRLRKKLGLDIRYYACGEYGLSPVTGVVPRAHYHAIIFGWFPDDAKKIAVGKYGGIRYESKTLSDTWGFGITEVGEVTYQSCGYVARYCMKKLKDDPKKSFYITKLGFNPEFTVSSKRPAIGLRYYEKNKIKIYKNDNIVGNYGFRKIAKPPKYFDKRLDIDNPIHLIEVKNDRSILSIISEAADYTKKGALCKEHLFSKRRVSTRDRLSRLVRKS